MRKIITGAVLAGGLLVGALVAPAQAGPWLNKAAGEATMSNYRGLTISLSAWEAADGTVGGQLQYEFWQNGTLTRKWHVAAESVCFGTTTDGLPYATAVGPVEFQEGTSFVGKTYAGVSVTDNPSGADRVRAGHFDNAEEALDWDNQCDTPAAASFPAIVGSGGYEIKSR